MHVIKKNGHKTGVQKDNVTTRKEKKSTYILTTSLKNKETLPLSKMSYTNSPPKYMTTLIPKLLPIFVTNDKEQVTEKQSSPHHQKS